MKRWAATALTAGLIIGGVIALPQAAFAATDVTGTITEADGTTPIGYGSVTLTSTSNSDDIFVAHVQVDGTFSTAATPPGTYTVYFEAFGHAPEYYSNTPARASATTVTVADGAPTVLDASLGQESTITGTITDENNNPIDDALVRVYAENNDWELAGQIFTGADGKYSIDGLAAGNVKVFATDYFGDSLQAAWFGGGYSLATASVLAVPGAGGSVVGDVVLPVGAIINGSILDPMGLPVRVDVIAQGAGLDGTSDGFSQADGLYEISGLHPQAYSVATDDYRGLFAPATPKVVTTSVGTPGSANFALAMDLVAESEFSDIVTVLSGPTTVEPGKTYTWVIDLDGADNVYSILYPNPVFVGGAVRTANGPVTITLTIPAAAQTGAGKLTFSTFVDRGEGSMLLREYLPITVSAPQLAASGVSAETGFFGLLALIFSVVGGVLLWMSRRSIRTGIRSQH